MAKDGGRSQGFGRVSAHTRPSPYSPLQFRGSLPGAMRDPSPPRTMRRRPRAARRAVFVVAILAALIAGVSYVALFRGPGLPVPRAATTPAAAPAALDAVPAALARSEGTAARR